MARFCGHCGSPMADGSHFCGHCGASDGLTTSTRPAQQTVLQNGAAFNRGGYMPAQYPARQRRSGKSRKGLILALCSVFAVMIVVGSVVLSNMLIGAGNYPYYNGGSSGSSYTQPTSGPGVYGTPLELSGLRENYTHLVGGGNDVITIMVYLCGADLESEYGCATTDLQEMLDADIGDNINLIVQTGGASSWYNDLVSGERCQRWQLRGGNMTLIDDTLGQQNMTEPGTLSSFVTYCAQNYPADRNILILWDHGGGTMGGFGYDENFRSSPSMSLEKMDGALASAGVNFDIVGFDACLMSTVETAYMLSDYADYLIASEESEPGDGWYYTNWLSELSHNTSMDTVELGAKIIDDFVTVCADSNSSNEATLSILELRQMPYLYEQLCAFFNDAQEQLADMQFERLSRARSDSKDFGENSFDQIDVVDFAGNADLSLSDSLTRAVDSIVRYRNTYNISGANGLAMYFPYEWLDYYESMFTLQKQLGFGSESTNFFSNFVSVMVGGQSAYQSTPTGGTGSESSDYTDTEWFDSAAIDSYSGLY
ncbi:MAG: hypothetical protein GXZ02_00125, partial [Clostridiales bacterium]|nr:hypothetical protein [Clostridiales bacterium]